MKIRITLPFISNPRNKPNLFFHKKIIRLITTCILLTIFSISSGCSRTDFLYSISGWAVLGKIRDYFDLTEKQDAFLTNKIDNIFDWHKKQGLPKTISFLKEFNKRFENGLTEQDLNAIGTDYAKLWDALMKKALPQWTIFFISVNSDQIRELPAKLDKRNEFLEKKLKLKNDEWEAEEADWLIKTLDDWIDGLSEDQVTKIKSWIKPDRTFVKVRLEQRQFFHEWFVEELKK